jgi:Spy/CpxP family protein refolding chaperone
MKYMNFFKAGIMKNNIIALLTMLVLFTSAGFAQNPNQEKLTAYKIAFFTKRLNLTPGEAEKFWPLYNDYQNKRLLIQNERAYLIRKYNLDASGMTEKEYAEADDKLIDLQVKETELAVTFHKQVKEVLSPEKVFRLYQTENQYRLTLLNQLQQKRPQRENAGPGGGLPVY